MKDQTNQKPTNARSTERSLDESLERWEAIERVLKWAKAVQKPTQEGEALSNEEKTSLNARIDQIVQVISFMRKKNRLIFTNEEADTIDQTVKSLMSSYPDLSNNHPEVRWLADLDKSKESHAPSAETKVDSSNTNEDIFSTSYDADPRSQSTYGATSVADFLRMPRAANKEPSKTIPRNYYSDAEMFALSVENAFERFTTEKWFKTFKDGTQMEEYKPRRAHSFLFSNSELLKENAILKLGQKFANGQQPVIQDALHEMLRVIETSINRGKGSVVAKAMKDIIDNSITNQKLDPDILEKEVRKFNSPKLNKYMQLDALTATHKHKQH